MLVRMNSSLCEEDLWFTGIDGRERKFRKESVVDNLRPETDGRCIASWEASYTTSNIGLKMHRQE